MSLEIRLLLGVSAIALGCLCVGHVRLKFLFTLGLAIALIAWGAP